MPEPALAVIVPTRGRPENIQKVISAWDFTNAWDHAHLVLAVDGDDPKYRGYADLFEQTRHPDTDEALFSFMVQDRWTPMVYKLNKAAVALALSRKYFALGFAGDDHLPQTIGWAARYLTVLRELGTGMVYGDDGYQGRKLSTEWAVTADAVRALDRMVPADVEHMYCDNAMMDLFGGAKAMRHLPEVRIEHMHPYAGKAERDDQYDRVNHRDQFAKDRRAYESWRDKWKISHVALIRDLRKGRPDVTEPNPIPARPKVAGSAPRRVQRSGPTSVRRQARTGPARSGRTPLHFRNVRAATPEDIMLALADFAAQVPADQEIVELGVFCGRTALQLAWGAEQGNGAHVTAIDPWDLPGNVYSPPFTDAESRTWARHWVDTLGYADKITLIQGFSHEVAEHWVNPDVGYGRKVGLLYVDGDHTKEGARRDIVTWAPHLAEGARIAVDDYGHPDWPGVAQAVDELVDEGVLEPVTIFHDRLAVTRLRVETAEESADLVDLNLRRMGSSGLTAITSVGVSPSPEPDEVDEMFAGPDPEVSRRGYVQPGELDEVPPGKPIDDLNLVNLKALAKVRGIVLGARKDKRAEIIQALAGGK